MSDRTSIRRKLYAVVSLGLLCLVGLVAISTLLARGRLALDEKVYRYPHKTLHHLYTAERRFRRQANRYARSLEELGEAGLITQKLSEGNLGDYRYRVISADEKGWGMGASPAAVTSTSLFYFMDHTGIVRARTGAPADASCEIYWSPGRDGWGR